MWWIWMACGAPETSNNTEPVKAAGDVAKVAAAQPQVDVKCDVELHPFTQVDVYEKPVKGATVVGQYPEGTLLRVEGIKGPWAAVTPTDPSGALPSGWMGIQLLTTNLRTTDDYPKRSEFRGSPTATERKPMPEVASLTVEACQGEFLRVSWEKEGGGNGEGWLSPTDHCPLSNTTCP
ncbi:MAG: hypothetical protein AAGA48_17150 [Myxococcota bacterium]